MPAIAQAIAGLSAAAAAGSFLANVAITAGQVLISVGLNWAVRSLIGRSEQRAPVSGTSFDVTYGADGARTVAAGLVATAGAIAYDNTHDEANRYWQRVYVLSHYPVDGLSRVAIGGKWVELDAGQDGHKGHRVITGEAANHVWIRFYDGRQGTADRGLVDNANPAGRWTGAAVGTGICYAVVTSLYDRHNFTAAPQLLFELRGARLYDWRKDDTAGGSGAQRLADPSTHEFTQNPVVIEYNYRIGLGVNGDPFCGMEMDASDLPLDKWTAAANICDEDVDGEARFRASLIIDSNSEHGDTIDALSRSTGALIVNGVTGTFPIVGTDQPVVASLDDDDIVDGTRPVFTGKRSMADLVNSVSGTFPDPGNSWSPAPYDRQTDVAILAADRRTRDVRMDFATVPSRRQATQLAATYLSENRFEARIANLVVRPRWRVLEAGDWIRFNSKRWGARTYVVTSRTIQSLEQNGPRNVVLTLQERDGAIYEGSGIVTPVITPPANQAPRYLAEVQDLAVTPVTLAGDGGRAAAGIRVSWSQIADPSVTGVQIEYRARAEPALVHVRQLYDGVSVAFLSEGVVSQSEYEVRTRLLTTGRTAGSGGAMGAGSGAAPTAWRQVTTGALPHVSLTVELDELQDDTKDLFIGLRADLDELSGRMDLLGAAAGTTVAEQTVKVLELDVASDVARAAIIAESTARASAIEAVARTVTALEASLGDSLASGLMKLEVDADEDNASARIAFLVRASKDAGRFEETGLVLEVYTEDGTPKGRALIKSDRFIVTGGDNEHVPFVFEDGVLKLNAAHIKRIVSGIIASADGRLTIDLNAPSIIMDDGT